MPEPALVRQRWILMLRWLLTVFILGLLIWSLDFSQLISEMSRFSLYAIGLGLLVSVLQVAVSAWRWRFTAHRLGLGLPMSLALREYYLAVFLNQCLPGGVVGDVNRAWRHGRGSGRGRLSLHAVMIERLSGQVVMALVAIGSWLWLMSQFPDIRPLAQLSATELPGYGLVLAGLVLLLAVAIRAWRSLRTYLAELGRDIYRGLLNRSALPIQLATSLVVMATYLSVFLLLAFSSGEHPEAGDVFTLLALCSLLLLAMVIPLTVAGWGVREGAAAMLWPLAGLPAEQGVALSVGYGLVVLVSSLPGALFVFTRPVTD